MKTKKVLALAMAAAMAGCFFVGCDNKSDSGNNSTNSGNSTAASTDNGDNAGGGGSVYWLNFKPEADETLQKLAKKYKEDKGVDVKVLTAASGTYDQQLSAEMEKSDAPTIFVIGNPSKAKQWSSYTLDLKDTDVAKELTSDAYNMYDGDKLAAIGYCYECYGIIVNPKLVEQAGHKVEDIKDFDSLKTVVEDIHKRASELGFDAFTSCDMDDSSSWRFTGHMANIDYYYEEKAAGGAWTETPATITGEFLPQFKNLYDLCINNSLTDPKDLATGGHDAANEFTSGKAAFTIQGSWEYPKYSEKVPDVKMIPYYCGADGEEKAGLNCGTENYWAVNAKASEEDQKATLDFMYWCVTDKSASEMLVEAFGVMPYKQAVESTNGFLKDAATLESNGNYVMDWAFNYQPNVDEYRKALVSALNAYNADQSDANWDQVKAAFVDGWATQYTAANAG